ncbi:hypothetical protein AVEN_217046-1 [Araneus ventricosus]|uniref:Reverse transcriptase domain-containing protein n=1 Tax=Araneus ventricosus TaxID=182803 RepID=A0A4Y2W6C3_ARAVE|nr:hypothetical protein AVEN_217046-1 [Araneus ventricosus]
MNLLLCFQLALFRTELFAGGRLTDGGFPSFPLSEKQIWDSFLDILQDDNPPYCIGAKLDCYLGYQSISHHQDAARFLYYGSLNRLGEIC